MCRCQKHLYCLAIVGILCASSQVADAAILRVDPAATGTGDGSSWPNAITSLPAALAASSFGDQIWLIAEEYSPGPNPGDFFDLKAGRQIYGGFSGGETSLAQRNPDPTENGCVLVGSGTNNVIVKGAIGATFQNTTLDGFTLEYAAANAIVCGNGGDPSSPTLRNLRVRFNDTPNDGAALLIRDGSIPIVEDCRFEVNGGEANGGAVACVDVPSPGMEFNRCKFIENICGAQGTCCHLGGAVYCSSSVVAFNDCDFFTNRATFAGQGGAAYFANGSSATLRRCTFDDNSADEGGALRFVGSDGFIVRCSFIGNSANGSGSTGNGGAFSFSGASSVTIYNTGFIGNFATSEGGAIYNERAETLYIMNGLFALNSCATNGGAINLFAGDAATIINSTFSDNTAVQEAGGLFADTFVPSNSVIVQNSIFWNNEDGASGSGDQEVVDAQLQSENANVISVEYSCIEDSNPNDSSIPFGGAADHNIDDDPEFSNPATNNYRLTIDSECINNAADELVADDDLDVDGDNDTGEKTPLDLDLLDRFFCIVDMGAYEFQDCDGDGTDDAAQIEACDADPECEDLDADDNGILDFCEPLITDPNELARNPIAIFPLQPVSISDLQHDQGWAIAGSATDSLLTNAGAVYFYRTDGQYWYGPTRKTSSNSQSFNKFGLTVGISGGWAVAGAPGADSETGEANVFKLNTANNTWSEFGDLLESATGLYVGQTVAIHGDVIAVAGASDSAVSGSSSGLVYVYRYNATAQEWQQEVTLIPSDTNALYFGISLAVSGDWIAVGYSTDENGPPAGVEMFHYDGTEWDADGLLDYPGLPDQDESGFGVSLAMDEDLLVAGSVGYADGDGNGEAYVYFLDGAWTHVETLNVEGVGADDLFGLDVDIWKNTVVGGAIVLVGASAQESNNSGAAYVFLLNECFDETLSHELQPTSPTSNARFGHLLSQFSIEGLILEPRAGSTDRLYEYSVLWP
ncbi:MAG TPA: hypothetical protein VNT79_11270, partial [Phycisphaerae bacterium]|nr:hypothetical protein [Phycisphaerae bacterium]